MLPSDTFAGARAIDRRPIASGSALAGAPWQTPSRKSLREPTREGVQCGR